MAHDTILSKAHRDDTAPPRVEVDGQRFRVWTARFATQWLPDTPSNRHPIVVW